MYISVHPMSLQHAFADRGQSPGRDEMVHVHPRPLHAGPQRLPGPWPELGDEPGPVVGSLVGTAGVVREVVEVE